MDMYKEWLEGTWTLESFTGKDEEGNVIDVMGPGATGFISYTSDGWISVEIIKADRMKYRIPDLERGTDEETLAAARSLFAYAGRYEVDEENAIVYHNLEFALVPNWIGSSQKRYINRVDDNTLELTADPARMGPEGKKLNSCLRWNRLEPLNK